MPSFELPLSPDGVGVDLRDGGRIVVRPIRPTDADELTKGFARLSERSRFLRFFTPLRELPDGWSERLSDLDHQHHRAWVAYDPDGDAPPPGLGVGVARLIELDDDPLAAEAAVAVTDDYHGRGIGRILLELVAGTAAAVGYERFVTTVLRENARMLDLARSIGEPVTTTADGAEVRIEVSLAATSDEQVAQGALYDLLRLAARLEP